MAETISNSVIELACLPKTIDQARQFAWLEKKIITKINYDFSNALNRYISINSTNLVTWAGKIENRNGTLSKKLSFTVFQAVKISTPLRWVYIERDRERGLRRWSK